MRIFIPKEKKLGETRIPLLPSGADKLQKLGGKVTVESGIGQSVHIMDAAYTKTGAQVSSIPHADLVLRLNPPTVEEIYQMQPGTVHISFMNPFQSPALLEAFKAQRISALSMEMIPRSTIAQKMDALSSQASLGGYVAVMLADQYSHKIFPMMMTPAGTIHASRVFIIGAGVAGLQAIATAKRLGARVDAFDTRPGVAEQVQSLGAKFVKVDLGEMSQTKDGYAKELTPAQLLKQQEAMAGICQQSDVVITTAQVFGKKAPRIITKEMIQGMRPGSVLVDMAVESGGNIEGSVPNEIVESNGVKIIGFCNLPGRVPLHASEMYSNNLANFVEHFWKKDQNLFHLDLEHEIIQKCLITHQGDIVHPLLK